MSLSLHDKTCSIIITHHEIINLAVLCGGIIIIIINLTRYPCKGCKFPDTFPSSSSFLSRKLYRARKIFLCLKIQEETAIYVNKVSNDIKLPFCHENS